MSLIKITERLLFLAPRQLEGHGGTTGKPPWGLKWRCSVWFATLVVGFGIMTDLVVYSIIIPVLPFRLEHLGYNGVSSLVGWLLFAYSAGLVISTIPIAMFSERHNTRRMPLVVGLLSLLGSQLMLMEASTYWVMCFARLTQGVSSSMVWVVGLAFLCDTAPESHVGRQLGFAMAGLSFGLAIGPPVGGVLYSHFGYRGPFVFAEVCIFLDLAGRLLIIERKEAAIWGFDPAALPQDVTVKLEQISLPNAISGTDDNAERQLESTSMATHVPELNVAGPESSQPSTSQATMSPDIQHQALPKEVAPLIRPRSLSLLAVFVKLLKSPRALVALLLTFVYGLVYSSIEPALPLHLQAVWNFDSSKVGLVFLAAVVPTLFSSPLSGWYADYKGSEWVTFISLFLAIPWWAVMSIQFSVPLLIVAFAVENFFTSGVVSPITTELAAVSRKIDGVGYAHVYGAFNLVYGVGTSVGPIIGGQIYDHVKRGWAVICWLAAGSIAICLVVVFFNTGEDPLFGKLKRFLRRQRATRRHGSMG